MASEPTLRSALAQHWHIARSLRSMQIRFYPERCQGVWQCYEVCPIGCWTPDRARRAATFHDPERCIACGACVRQCPSDAIELK